MSKDLADPSDVECPVRSNSRLLGNILEVPERGLTLREAGSELLGTMLDPEPSDVECPVRSNLKNEV